MNSLEQRLDNLHTWLQHVIKEPYECTALACDASFRRYFRIQTTKGSFIAMDAPPNKEDCQPFVAIAAIYQKAKVPVPTIYASDLTQGYVLLEDFGDNQYFRCLNANNVDTLYSLAFSTLIDIMRIPQHHHQYIFPPFDYADFMRELRNCQQWFLQTHLQITLTPSDHRLLDKSFDFLIRTALNQPQVCVHRDYHSRNLMLRHDHSLGVLDFQDAVFGPISYDLVSLLRDCYIAWPRSQVEHWVTKFHQRLLDEHLLKQVSYEQFLRWFDLMGLQRHLKCMFIFSRKLHRDGSTAFLADIPRIVHYALDVSSRYPEVHPLQQFLQQQVLAKLEEMIAL